MSCTGSCTLYCTERSVQAQTKPSVNYITCKEGHFYVKLQNKKFVMHQHKGGGLWCKNKILYVFLLNYVILKFECFVSNYENFKFECFV